jgi:hypothetical protein
MHTPFEFYHTKSNAINSGLSSLLQKSETCSESIMAVIFEQREKESRLHFTKLIRYIIFLSTPTWFFSPDVRLPVKGPKSKRLIEAYRAIWMGKSKAR